HGNGIRAANEAAAQCVVHGRIARGLVGIDYAHIISAGNEWIAHAGHEHAAIGSCSIIIVVVTGPIPLCSPLGAVWPRAGSRGVPAVAGGIVRAKTIRRLTESYRETRIAAGYIRQTQIPAE